MTITLHQGDCIEVLRRLTADSFDTCITSPPYWGQRDYGVQGQIGLEESLAAHLEKLVDVFRAVRRVLKPSGTLWINYGDSYASKPNGRKAKDIVGDDRAFQDKPMSTVGPIDRSRRIERGAGRWGGGNLPCTGNLKPKDLIMAANRLAIALQDDGWWVRAENIWGKTNPMPESVRDRPGMAHEKIFMLSKSARPFYNADAVRYPKSPKTISTYGCSWGAADNDGTGQVKKARMGATMKPHRARSVPPDNRHRNPAWNHQGLDGTPRGEGRALRNYEPPPMDVWEFATRRALIKHNATFPPELVRRCILAGCPPGGHVLDPFGGSGTTGLVAREMGCRATLIELSPDYARAARKLIEGAG